MSQKQLSISQTIFKQLQESKVDGYLTAGAHLNAWGVGPVKANDEPDTHGAAWIRFNVDGSKYRGVIRVALQANNSYTVTFEGVDNATSLNKTFHVVKLVNCTELATTIDKFVEG